MNLTVSPLVQLTAVHDAAMLPSGGKISNCVLLDLTEYSTCWLRYSDRHIQKGEYYLSATKYTAFTCLHIKKIHKVIIRKICIVKMTKQFQDHSMTDRRKLSVLTVNVSNIHSTVQKNFGISYKHNANECTEDDLSPEQHMKTD